MCVLAIAWRVHPEWPLVLIGNRDEFHARPSEALHRWPDRPGIIGGRDTLSGGSWLGVTGEGRMAVVTNFRNPDGPAPDKASRGALVSDWLDGQGDYAALTVDLLDDFNPFSFLALRDGALHHFTNRPEPMHRELTAGLYGQSNGLLDEPWPKTERIKALLANWLASTRHDPEGALTTLRSDDAPQVAREDGPESPIFILDGEYGARCSTFVAVNKSGAGQIIEWRYDATGQRTGKTRIDFHWPAGAV